LRRGNEKIKEIEREGKKNENGKNQGFFSQIATIP
jgi:hypothetical protein